MSPGLTVVEPAVGGFLFTGLLFGLFGLSPGSTFIWSEGTGTELLHRAVSLDALSLLGAVVGAVAGERSRDRSPLAERNRWRVLRHMWLSLMAYAGLLLTGTVAFMIMMQETDETLVDSPGLFWLGFCGAAVGAGVIAQAMGEKRALLAWALGPLWFYLTLGVTAVMYTGGGKLDFLLFLGLAGALLSVLSLIGAAVTHEYIARRQPGAAAPPQATARVAG